MVEIDTLSPEELVGALADPALRYPAFTALQRFGPRALPAIREGLRHGDWQVRKWSVMYLDHHADPETLLRVIPLLRDPKSDVRLWAVHSLSGDTGKEGDGGSLDVVPHLIERAVEDTSLRVRRMALAMLATRPPDPRIANACRGLLAAETDRKLRHHAERALRAHQDHAAEAGP